MEDDDELELDTDEDGADSACSGLSSMTVLCAVKYKPSVIKISVEESTHV